MHVSQKVVALRPRQLVDIDHLGLDEHDRAGRALVVDGIDDDQSVPAVLNLGDQGDASDARLDHPHPRRERHPFETARHLHPKGIIGPQDVPHPGDEHPHDPHPTGWLRILRTTWR